MYHMRIAIRTLAPVVLTAGGTSLVLTESHPYISGTVILGVLASRYVQLQRLQKNAHTDETFRSLFFDSLRFVHAYISQQGQRAIVLPLSILKAKAKKEGMPYLLDMMKDSYQAGYKALKGFYYVDAAGTMQKAIIKNSISFHMSRNSDAERLGGHSQDGKVYNYDALDAGQTFIGEIIGEKERLETLRQALRLDPENRFETQLGRSKYTQYGHCQIQFGAVEKIESKAVVTRMFLRLDTPALAIQGTGENAEDIISEVVRTLNSATNSQDFALGKVYASPQEVENFVGIWGMRRPRQFGLSAGSIFEVIKNKPWTEQDMKVLNKIQYAGIGDRVEEGFGQLRLWSPNSLNVVQPKKSISSTSQPIHSEEVKRILRAIIMRRIRENVRLAAYQDVYQAVNLPENSTHALARLESILGDRQDTAHTSEKMRQFILQEVPANSPMELYLHAVKVRGTELYDLLAGRKPNPYTTLDFSDVVPEPLAQQAGLSLASLPQGELFYEYWLWFFRHGRKRTIAIGKEREDAR